ncbi:hypothetical protein V9K67_20010 [Paraflavisolibacter sp. H34]|uniref:hypothetical protein n=1 Tax=Huijunlia imazamoxiresistens TaxID=3127457 RepID=UPI003018BEF0
MKPPTLHQFIALETEEQMEVLQEYGVYLDVYRNAEQCRVALFQLNSFYCEVWLHKRQSRVLRVNAFSSYRRLDFYLDQIDLSEIYVLLD